MAVAVDYDRLERDVPAGVPIAIDTSAVIAYLQGGEPASGPAAWLFDGRVAQARNQAFFSAITAAEILVAPSRRGDEAVAAVDGFLTFFREITVAPVTLVVARAAARLRATSGLSLPDSIVLATASSAKRPSS